MGQILAKKNNKASPKEMWAMWPIHPRLGCVHAGSETLVFHISENSCWQQGLLGLALPWRECQWVRGRNSGAALLWLTDRLAVLGSGAREKPRPACRQQGSWFAKGSDPEAAAAAAANITESDCLQRVTLQQCTVWTLLIHLNVVKKKTKKNKSKSSFLHWQNMVLSSSLTRSHSDMHIPSEGKLLSSAFKKTFIFQMTGNVFSMCWQTTDTSHKTVTKTKWNPSYYKHNYNTTFKYQIGTHCRIIRLSGMLEKRSSS